MNGHAFVRLIEALDAESAPDLDSHRDCTRGQDRFEMLHFDRHAGSGRTWQAIQPFRGVDGVVKELDSSEMSARTARLIHPMRARGRSVTASRFVLRGSCGSNVVQ
jgi:hypothetical protein